jgi:hypothetical protein
MSGPPDTYIGDRYYDAGDLTAVSIKVAHNSKAIEAIREAEAKDLK